MKKIILLLLIANLFTGCSIYDIQNKNIDSIVFDVLKQNNNLYTRTFEGYQLYIPSGMNIVSKIGDNIQLYYNNDKYYLYIDVTSYYHKVEKSYKEQKTVYFSKNIKYNEKQGYIEINKTDNKYFIEVMYNYAKIEVCVEEKEIKDSLIQICTILNSIKYNDAALESLIGTNALNYKAETFNIFKPTRETGDFLDYVKEYDIFYDKYNELPDEDKIETDSEQ